MAISDKLKGILGKGKKQDPGYEDPFTPISDKPAVEKPGPKKPLKESGDSVQAELMQLFNDGVLWLEGDTPKSQSPVFVDDFQPGLTEQEKEVITLQCKMFLKGHLINSPVLSSGELTEIRGRMDSEGFSEEGFIEKCLKIASVRDDKRDIDTVKKRIEEKKTRE